MRFEQYSAEELVKRLECNRERLAQLDAQIALEDAGPSWCHYPTQRRRRATRAVRTSLYNALRAKTS